MAGEPTAAQLETDTSMSHIDIDKSYIQRAPAPVASRAMEEIVISTPGFSKDENGRYHFQGAHSQGEFVVDGQTISDQTGVTFSNSIDPGIAQSLEVIYGNVPAEYGEKIGAVINMVTRSGLGSGGFKGDVHGAYSRFDTYEAGANLGGGNQSLRLLRFARRFRIGLLHRPGQPEQSQQPRQHAAGLPAFRLLVPGLVELLSVHGPPGAHGPSRHEHVHAGGQRPGQTGPHRTTRTTTSDGRAFSRLPRSIDTTVFGRLAKFTLYSSAGDTPITSALEPVPRQLRHHALAAPGSERCTRSRSEAVYKWYPDQRVLPIRQSPTRRSTIRTRMPTTRTSRLTI